MRIEASNLSPAMMPKVEELLYRMIRDATDLGIGLDSVTLSLCELDPPKSGGLRRVIGNLLRWVR
jgi:hypothetical protein